MGEINNIVCDYLGILDMMDVEDMGKDREAMKQYYLEHKERFRQLDEISIDTMGVLIGKRSLKLEDAAKRANMSEEMFGRKMQEML